MNPNQLIPNPDILPAPWGLFNLLLIFTFILHLIITNILIGGGLMVLWYTVFNRESARNEGVDRAISLKLPFALAFTVNFGVAPLLFLQVNYGQFIYVSSVLMAVFWLSIFVLIILAYYGVYLFNYKYNILGAARPWVIGLSLVFLLLVGFFFTNSLVLMEDPSGWSEYFRNPNGTIIHISDHSLIPRYLHFVLASVATGGLIMGVIGWWKQRQGQSQISEIYENGLILYGVVTILQFIVGMWYLGSLSQKALEQVIFGSRIAFPIFMISIIMAVASILFSFGKMVWKTVAASFATILLMILFRYFVRDAYLGPFLESSPAGVSTQFTPILLFFIVFIAGLAVVAYMIKLAQGARGEAVK